MGDRFNFFKRRSARVKTSSATSSPIGYVIIAACVAMVLVGVTLTQQFDRRTPSIPRQLPDGAISAGASSSTWSCPISGTPTTSDSLLIANPNDGRDAFVEITAYNPEGEKVGSQSITINAYQQVEVPVTNVSATDSTSIIVESFSGSIVVFRSMQLSDGNEYTSCLNTFGSTADFVNLETLRNANSHLVLANPYAVAVVVDVTAQLFDNITQPPRAVVDENRGVIIPAHGKVTLDLQALFGRFPIVGIHVESRSGFFAAETLQSFSGAESAQGQTIVASSPRVSDAQPRFWVGAAPTRIVARNDSPNSFAVESHVVGTDHRELTGDAHTISAGTLSVLENLGADFSNRVIVQSVDASANKNEELYWSWIHASGEAVSSGSTYGHSARRSIVPVSGLDVVHVYNPSKKKATVTVHAFGSSGTIKRTIEPGAYSVITLEELALTSDVLVDVVSSTDLIVASSDIASKRYAPGSEIQS